MCERNGLLFVLSVPPMGGEADYDAWYDEEHAPARLGVAGIRTARRYRDVNAGNSYLAYYDLDSVDVLDRAEYRALSSSASPRERNILARMAPMDRRVYWSVATPGVSAASDPAICGDILLAVWWSPDPGTEADFNAWYTEEHIPLLMKVPGWLRIRRYELNVGGGPKYLALHDLASEETLDRPEHDATLTAWRERLVESRRMYERRVYRLWRRYER